MSQRKNELGGWERLPARVEVHWLDSNSQPRWRDVEESKREMPDLECVSVGFFFQDEKEYIRLSQSLAAVGTVDAVLTIPRSAVKKIVRLVPRGKG